MSDADEFSKTVDTGYRASSHGESAGQVIGRYKLLEELGEGGMGTVWMAQQSEPVQRRVALKIIKLGMDTREVVGRFEVERQALALMNHPHIAKVFDAGATTGGRPFFVMELVRGIPITTYCDQAKLGLRERLTLFMQVCHAIQHAHHKGIIHRDVKPSNILVSLQDGEAQPKVIDFGIAKATNAELTQETLYTQLSQVIGTPEYMAPEQAASGGLDIDTRADVYSLGVLLYELLTGTKPFDLKQAIVTAGFEEMLRVIREVDPAKPSTRVSSLGESANEVANLRRVDTQVLNRNLRGDLDWIVMRALEKDRSRRYGTASAFADDIANYLNDEAVDAAPPSASYRLKKLLRRRKRMVLSLATIALLLVAGSVGTGIGWWKTSQAKQSLNTALEQKADLLEQEEQQRLLAEESEKRARMAEAEARREAERATAAEAASQARADELEQVADFQAEQLAGLNVPEMGLRMRSAMLDAIPEAQRAAFESYLDGLNFTDLARDTLRDNLFERTVDAINTQFLDQPQVQAYLLQATATTWIDLGLLETARAPQERALAIRRKELGDENPGTLDSISELAYLLQSQGRPAEAEPLFREVLDIRRRVLGDEHYDTLTSMNNLGAVLDYQGKLSEAEPLYREALEVSRRLFGDDSPRTLTSISSMGSLLESQGKAAEAEAHYLEAVDGSRRVLGEEHPNTLISINSLAVFLQFQGRSTEAERHMREVLAIQRRIFGGEHPDTLRTISKLGIVLQDQGRLEEAETLQVEGLSGLRRVLGDAHPDSLTCLFQYSLLRKAQGKLTESVSLNQEALDGYRRLWGAGHPELQNPTDALDATLRTILKSSRESGSELQQAEALTSLGSFLLSVGRHEQAEGPFVEALDLWFEQVPESDARPWQCQLNLGLAVAGQGRFDEAEGALEESALWLLENPEALAAVESDATPQTTGEVLQAMIDFQTTWHAAMPGKGHDSEAASWRAKLDAWNTQQSK